MTNTAIILNKKVEIDKIDITTQMTVIKESMAVMVSVIPNGDTNITEELLSEELQNRGIVSGVDRELLNEIAEHGIYKKVYIVAQGEYATPGKEQLELVCKGVEKRGDNYYAGINGRVSLDSRRLEVKNHLVIEGDVGYHMRNVAFSGDIHVRGDILTNVEMNVEGSLEVDGVIEGATVNA